MADIMEDSYFCADLFVSKEYETKVFDFDLIQQKVLCSLAASTDHDLTGQVVWPVSIFLSWYLISQRDFLKDKTVLELGAGVGLSGLVASHFADKVYLTDGSEVVLDLLEKNVGISGRSNNCTVSILRWGDHDSIQAFEQQKSSGVDVLIGADVVCWPSYIQPLLETVKYFLLKSSAPFQSKFLCGFVCRAKSIEDSLFQQAQATGLAFEEVQPDTFLPMPIPSNVKSHMKLQILVFQLDTKQSQEIKSCNFSGKSLAAQSSPF
ncbi:hypothetical protein ABG067_004134 [Albugo candida]